MILTDLQHRLIDIGAEDGTRTRDLNLGKVALYQLSYFRRMGDDSAPSNECTKRLLTGRPESPGAAFGVRK